jgi:hypothetical protein
MAFQYGVTLRNDRVGRLQFNVGGFAWVASTAYATGAMVYNGANYYIATTGGVSASSGGPTGTAASITDNTVTWKYVTPTCKIFSGAEPATCATADPTGLLATINLPAPFITWTGAVTTLAGSWSATASGGSSTTPVTFRIYDGNTVPVCHIQGNCSTDLVMTGSITTGQTVTITSFAVTGGQA